MELESLKKSINKRYKEGRAPQLLKNMVYEMRYCKAITSHQTLYLIGYIEGLKERD